MKFGGNSCQGNPKSDIPSPTVEKKSGLNWSELTPSKKLSKNLDSLSSSSEGPGAGAGGEGKGYAVLLTSNESGQNQLG